MKNASLIILILVFSLAYGQIVYGAGNVDTAAEGELQIESFPLSSGVIAKRVFYDAQGRVIRSISYTGYYGDIVTYKPEEVKESELKVFGSEEMEYDEQSRKIEYRNYDKNSKLLHFYKTTYSPDGSRNYISYNSGGVKTGEERDWSQGHTLIYFDDTGTRAVFIYGSLPQDIDLYYGWGKEVAGLSCGISLNSTTTNPSLESLWLWFTIKNQSQKEVEIETCSVPYQQIEIELRDDSNTLVLQNIGYINKRKKYLLSLGRGKWQKNKIGPQKAGPYGGQRSELKEWYSDLPEGKYSVSIRYRINKNSFLESNKVSFEVVKIK